MLELRALKHPLEHGDREVEVGVLLHVEVDELRRAAGRLRQGQRVERNQAVRDPLDRLVERPQRELARDGGDLHRHVVDVVAGEQLEGSGEAVLRLAFAEHGLAQQVEVEAGAVGAQRLNGFAEFVRARVGDEMPHHAPQNALRRRHHHPRQRLAE